MDTFKLLQSAYINVEVTDSISFADIWRMLDLGPVPRGAGMRVILNSLGFYGVRRPLSYDHRGTPQWRRNNRTVAVYVRDPSTGVRSGADAFAMAQAYCGVKPRVITKITSRSHKYAPESTVDVYQGRPCNYGHSGQRYVSTYACVECNRLKSARRNARPGTIINWELYK